jgi:hypothetical protein
MKLNAILSPLQVITCAVIENSQELSTKSNISLSTKGSIIYRGLGLKHFWKGMTVIGIVSSVEDHG